MLIDMLTVVSSLLIQHFISTHSNVNPGCYSCKVEFRRLNIYPHIHFGIQSLLHSKFYLFFQRNPLFIVLKKESSNIECPSPMLTLWSTVWIIKTISRVVLQKIVKEKSFVFGNLLILLLVCDPLLISSGCPLSFIAAPI